MRKINSSNNLLSLVPYPQLCLKYKNEPIHNTNNDSSKQPTDAQGGRDTFADF